MVGTLLVKGMLAGLIAGLVIFCFFKVYGEPRVESAIAIEEQNSGVPAGMVAEPELVSRQTQAGAGLLTGILVYGAAVGGLFAIAFAFANGRLDGLGARNTAMLLAAVGLVAAILVPALKYPANPPAVGSADTIDARTELYFVMMAVSLLAAAAAIMTACRLAKSIGGWKALVVAAGAYATVIALTLVALPSVNEVPEVFPADELWSYRVMSLSGHVIFWVVLGIAFDALHRWPATSRRPPFGSRLL